MTLIKVKCPTRVDIAGGTIDLWPLNAILGGTCTINYAIGIHSYVELAPLSGVEIKVNLEDLKFEKTYSSIVDLLNDPTPAVRLIRIFVEHFKPSKGFSLKTKSESPVGAGLGGSSSLCVGLIQAFNTWLGLKQTPLEIVFLAHNLEAQLLGTLTGTQDYFAPIVGGVCVIDYLQDKTQFEKLSAPIEFIAERSFLVYTGQPHHSGLNNWQVVQDVVNKRPETLSALKGIQRKAFEAREMCMQKSWDRMTSILQKSYELRTKLSPVFTSPEIERLKTLSLVAGASAIKICGAGGGGSVMIWSEPQKKAGVLEACQNAGFQILNATPVDRGSQIEVI